MKKLCIVIAAVMAFGLVSCEKTCKCTAHTYDNSGLIDMETEVEVDIKAGEKCSDGNTKTTSTMSDVTVTVETKCK